MDKINIPTLRVEAEVIDVILLVTKLVVYSTASGLEEMFITAKLTLLA